MESELALWVYALLFGVAVFAGFIDAVAGGGGLIALPALLAVGLPEHLALGTNKLQGCFGTLSATFNFARKGYVEWRKIAIGIFFTLLGAILGTLSVLAIDPSFLRFLIPVLLVGIFIYTLFSSNFKTQAKKALMKENAFYIVFGLILGFYDGFFGPGAGSFWTFAMLALIALETKRAVAHTKALNFTSNIVSLSVFIAGGQVLWILGFVMGAGQLIGGYLGAHMVIKKEVGFVRIIFLCVVAATTLKLLYDGIKSLY